MGDSLSYLDNLLLSAYLLMSRIERKYFLISVLYIWQGYLVLHI